jgi:hypothetical protein
MSLQELLEQPAHAPFWPTGKHRGVSEEPRHDNPASSLTRVRSSALETEIARMQRENATLKKELLARGLPLP